jgi:hypothetical protein
MTDKRESDDFEDDAEDAVEGDDLDVDHLMKDLESQKRRAGPKPGEPAWRRLEKYMEQKHTAELLSDFDDYELDADIDVDIDADIDVGLDEDGPVDGDGETGRGSTAGQSEDGVDVPGLQ